jgi:uncharacterized protein YqhQ
MAMVMVIMVIRVIVWVGAWVMVWIWIIVGVVWISIIIWSTIGLPIALGTYYSILNKSDLTNRISVKKMIFPDFGRLPSHGPYRDEVRFSPQRNHFFFCHVKFEI